MTNERSGSEIGTSARTLLLAVTRGAMGSLLSAVVAVALLPFVLSHLGSEIYGVWLALAAVLAVGALADAGVRVEVARRVARAHGRHDRAGVERAVNQGTSVVTVFAFAVAAAGMVLAPWLSDVLTDGSGNVSTESVVAATRVMFAVMAVDLVLVTRFAVLRGVQRSDAEAVAQMVALVTNAVVTVLGILGGWGMWALVWAYASGVGAANTTLALYARRLLPGLSFHFEKLDRTVVGGFLSLSGLAVLSQVGDVFDSQWDKIVIARVVGPEAVAAFHVGTSLVLQAKALTLLPLAPVLVAVSELRQRSVDEAVDVQSQLMKLGAVATATLLGSLFVLGPSFITLWLGHGYGDAGSVARIFAVGVIPTLVSAPITFQAFAENMHRLCALGAATNLLVNAVLSLGLTIQFGLLGAAYGSLAGNLAGATLFLAIARRRLSYWTPPPWRALVVSSGVVGAVALAWHGEVSTWPALVAAGAAVGGTLACVSAMAEGVRIRSALGLLIRGGTSGGA